MHKQIPFAKHITDNNTQILQCYSLANVFPQNKRYHNMFLVNTLKKAIFTEYKSIIVNKIIIKVLSHGKTLKIFYVQKWILRDICSILISFASYILICRNVYKH